MKKFNSIFILFLGMGFILSSCGGGLVSNTYLGELPSISKKYQDQKDELKEKAKKATDMNDAFKYDKEYKLAKEEGNKAIEEYLATATFETPILFDQNPDYKFEVIDLKVDGASLTRVNVISNIKITEDIKNKYGGFEKYIFAYIKAVDKDGNMIGKPNVMSSPLSGSKEPFVAESEVVLKGSVGNLREFENFDKIIFITKDEYNATK